MGVWEDARRGGIDLTPWGKFDRGAWAVYPLLFHLLDVAALAGVVWDRYLTRGQRRLIAAGLGLTLAEARCLVMFIDGLHDLGKLSAFQEQEAYPWARVSDTLRADIRDWQRMPHERASMHSVLHLLTEAGYLADTSDSPGVLVAQILGGHHGRFLQVDIDGAARASRVNLALGGPAWQDLRRRYFALLRHLTGATAVPSDVSVPAAVLITGVGIIADRLASQRHYWLPRAQAPAFGASEHYAQAVRDAPAVVEESGLARITLPQVPFTRAHGGLEKPNALQASVIEQLTAAVGEKGPGILVVTDATGGGKSVTALEAGRISNASGDTAGILWLLPTVATTDAAYDMLEAYVAAHQPEHAPVSLVHSHSYDNTAYTDHRLAAHEPSTSDAYWPDSDDGDDDEGRPAARERPEERVTTGRRAARPGPGPPRPDACRGLGAARQLLPDSRSNRTIAAVGERLPCGARQPARRPANRQRTERVRPDGARLWRPARGTPRPARPTGRNRAAQVMAGLPRFGRPALDPRLRLGNPRHQPPARHGHSRQRG